MIMIKRIYLHLLESTWIKNILYIFECITVYIKASIFFKDIKLLTHNFVWPASNGGTLQSLLLQSPFNYIEINAWDLHYYTNLEHTHVISS